MAGNIYKTVKFAVVSFLLSSIACESPLTKPVTVRPSEPSELISRAGNGRVELSFKTTPGEPAKEVRILWSDESGSKTIIIDVSGEPGEVVTREIGNLAEGDHEFEIRAYSHDGTPSEPACITAHAYGAEYAAELVGCSVSEYQAVNIGKDIKLDVGDIPTCKDFEGFRIEYVTTSGVEKKITVERPEKSLLLRDVDYGEYITYYSVFRPEPDALDTFRSQTVILDLDPEMLTMPRSSDIAVRIMTYNVRIFCGMAHANSGQTVESIPTIRDRLIDIINWADPDFVALQEVDLNTVRSGRDDQVGRLAKGTGMYGTFVDAIDRSKGKYGIGLLSREKPLSVKRVQLPGSEERRVMMIAEFSKCYVVNAHFSLTPADRVTSAGMLIYECMNISKPILIAGDLNETPNSSAISLLKQNFVMLTSETFTHPADVPLWCLDYIFGANLSKGAAGIRHRVLLEEKEASDHRPSVVDIEL